MSQAWYQTQSNQAKQQEEESNKICRLDFKQSHNRKISTKTINDFKSQDLKHDAQESRVPYFKIREMKAGGA